MSVRRSSIRTQLALLLAILVIPSIGGVAYSQYRSSQADREEVEARLLALAEAASLGIGQFLSDSERILERLAQLPEISSLDPTRCPAYFSALGQIYTPTYTNLFTWTLDGTEICSIQENLDPSSSVGAPPGLEEIKAADGFHVSLVHKGTASGKWTTGFSFPLRNEEGEKVGSITLSVDLIQFQEIVEGLDPPSDGIVSVVEQVTGSIVARSKDSDRLVGRGLEDPVAGSWGSSDIGISRGQNFDGEEFLWGEAIIQGTPWVVYAGRPVDAVLGPLYARWFRSALLALGAVIFVLLLGRLVSLRITTPLAALVSEVSAKNPGDPTPLTIQGPEEIAQVVVRLNEAWDAWRNAEAERERSVERMRSLVENAVTGIYISTEAGEFLEVNQAMVDLLGYESRDELMGTPVTALYESADERVEILATLGEEGVFRGLEVTWRDKKGLPVSVRLFGRKFKTLEGESAWEVIVEDVTKLRTLHEQYLQSQKMEALGRMAGGIAHDFNNLLTVVQGQAELILEDASVGEDLKSQVKEIADAADRGGNLNRQLLAFGRPRSSLKDTVDLNKILSGFELMLRRAVGEEINLDMVLGKALGPIRGDRGQLEQVVMNLVVNGRDAMPRGGSLLIETHNTELDDWEALSYPPATPGPHVVLSVNDTGVGIDPDTLPSIFEPFFSTKPESQGTGLGLATVYGIVTELKGHVRVESVPGEGTTFRLFFPLSSVETKTEPIPEPAHTPEMGSGLILLAEDEEAVRRLTTRILERAGYQVMAAENGQVALDMAMDHEGPLDLLISDVVMPELRGPDLAEALARAGKVKRVVLFSGYPEGMREADLRGLETWELLPKPFTSRDLLAAVQRALKVEE